jgi:outer membrane lipoprotein carrier protein
LEVCRRTDSGRSSRRRLPFSIERLFVPLIVSALLGLLPTARADDAGVATLERFLSGVKTLSANFRQELWTADQRLLETQNGRLSLSRPNRFSWIYTDPNKLEVIADGRHLWTYDAELAQATVAPFDDTVTSSPAMLLSGDNNVRDGFDVVQTYTADGLNWIKLAPKASGTDFRSITIGFEGEVPQRLELVDGLNQVTRIEFADVVVNPKIPESTFEFKPPAGVDVIGGGG